MIRLFLSVLTIGLASVGWPQDPSKPTGSQPHVPVGQVNLEDVLSFNEEYREGIESYSPNREAIEFLQTYPRQVTIEVFYGGWCSDSRAHVPSFIKVFQQIDNPNIAVTFVAVDRDKQQPAEMVKGRRIEFVPTFIVYAEGREIGRIVETPEGRLEEHLVRILKSQI